MKTIRPRAVDFRGLKLSAEEGFVLSRVDAPLSIKDIVSLTGLAEERVVEIVERLASEGAVEIGGEGGSSAPTSSAAGAPVEAAADESGESDESAEGEDDTAGADVDLRLDEEESEADKQASATDERAYRKVYEEIFRVMEPEVRAKAALTADGSHLMALCLDADPQVIQGVLTNPRSGFAHARMIAIHHRTAIGLEMIAKRHELLVDGQTQRRLLCNPLLPDTLLRRIVSPKPLGEVYKIAINREIPERSRIRAREQMQKKFMLASADERSALLMKTEGRCLIHLVNCALDSRTTQIMCAKTVYTPLFIQNLSRWSATPPVLLAHLLKQPSVRQNPGMKKMLLKHPNMPSDAKRNA